MELKFLSQVSSPTCAILCIFLCILQDVQAQSQSFRIAPSNVTVNQGQSATLMCVIDNRKGEVQWIKNGFALGYRRQNIPGYPTYQIKGVDNVEYNLFISTTKLADDDEYQCQVGPFGDNKELRGVGHLIVQVPSSLPEIEGYTNGSTVKIPSGLQSHSLTCRSNGGKPAATIVWFRNGVEVTEGIRYSVQPVGDKTQNAISILTMRPTKDDDEGLFTCQATNPAMPRPLETTVKLSVMYPPGPPRIVGYETGQVLKAGDTLKMTCSSQGGNPLAQVYWYRNGKELDFQFITTPNRAENEILFTVQPTDNEAVYRCDVTNLVLSNSNTPPLKAEVKLTVQFAPDKVTISGTQNAKADSLVKLKCVTGISNPAAKVSWFAKSRLVPETSSTVVASPQGGFITTSEISVVLGKEEMVVYKCLAANDALGQTVEDTLTLRVLYPPTSLNISGYTPGSAIMVGRTLHLRCESNGGNPLPTLTWTKGTGAGKKTIEGLSKETLAIKESQISFILRPEDNGVTFECAATSEAITVPMTRSVSLTVNFPPETINITMTPPRPKIGQATRLSCRSGTSNPQSKMTWTRNGEDIAGLNDGQEPGAWGGRISKTSLQIIPTSRDNGAIYACRASNNLLDHTISDAVTLNVAFKPEFPDKIPTKLTLREFTSSSINFTALGNPADITYTWTKEGQSLSLTKKNKRQISIPHFIQQKGMLIIANVTRRDAGSYNLQASNSEGRTDFKFQLDVQYAAGIPRTSGALRVDSGQDAVLECEVDANPIEGDIVKWSRPNFDMAGRTSLRLDELAPVVRNRAVSRLTVRAVTKADAGTFYCEVNNGFGSAITSVVELLIKFRPEITKTVDADRAATDVGKDATLKCTANGVPEVTFTWFKGDAPVGAEPKFRVTTYKIVGSATTKVSELTILTTTKEDFTHYKCVARNELGDDSYDVRLTLTSPPSVPIDVRFINATHNTIAIEWLPGFDGGSAQVFEIRYSVVGQPGYSIVDAPNAPNPETKYVPYIITGLKLGSDYEITVRGRNALGFGEYFSNYLLAKTSSIMPVMQGSMAYFDVPLIMILIVTIAGLALFTCNILLILFLIRRRRSKLGKGLPSETLSQANTLELYRPPVISDETKSYSTYERHSLADEYHDDYRAYDPNDLPEEEETKRFLPTPALRPENYYGSSRTPSTQNVYPGYPVPLGHHDPYMRDPRGVTSRERLYDDWAYPHSGMERYPSDSLARRQQTPDGLLHEGDEDEYREQLRQIQRSISPPAEPLPQGPASEMYARPAPAMSMRSSNQNVSDVYPRVPSRNYDPSDVPRYYPSMGYEPPRDAYGSGRDTLPKEQIV